MLVLLSVFPAAAETVSGGQAPPGCIGSRDGGFASCDGALLQNVAFSRQAIAPAGLDDIIDVAFAPPQAAAAVAAVPQPGAGVARLNTAQALVRQGRIGAAQGLAQVAASISQLRPGPWRSGYDATGWRLTRGRLAGLTPVGGAGLRLRPGTPLGSGLPGTALLVRWNAGFEGLVVPDFAFPPAAAARFMVARSYRGPVASVRYWWGSMLLPLPVHRDPHPAPRLFPQPSALLLPGPAPVPLRDPAPAPLPAIAPVPLPPAGPALGLALAVMALLRRRRGGRESPRDAARHGV